MAESTPILAMIHQIRDRDTHSSGECKHEIGRPHAYRLNYDESTQIVYISAEIHQDSLDGGMELDQGDILYIRRIGERGDMPMQILDKKLGGRGRSGNRLSMNSRVDISACKNSENTIYNHVKQGSGRYARMQFGFQYEEFVEENDGINTTLIAEIYYHFVLYEKDGKSVGAVMEGHVENVNPRIIDQNNVDF